jgi:hypothetical protein
MYNNLREDVIGGARKVYWTVTDTNGQQSSTSVYSNVSVNRLNDAVLADTVLNLTTVQPYQPSRALLWSRSIQLWAKCFFDRQRESCSPLDDHCERSSCIVAKG